MTRKDILDAALKCVNGDRDMQYGNPENSFEMIAELWSAYMRHKAIIDEDIEPKDVAAMLILLKIARICLGQPKYDNWIDIAGYAACGGEIDHAEEEDTRICSKFNATFTKDEADFICRHLGREPINCNPEDSCRKCTCNHKN